jgi:predicted phosphodiesterase
MKRWDLLLIFLLLPAVNSYAEGPEHVNLSWAQNATGKTMVVSWKTLEQEPSMVEFGGEKDLGSSVKAEHYFSEACGYYINYAELRGLEPDTKYFYRCGSPATWSEIQSFRTGHKTDKPFTFISYGDTRRHVDKLREVQEAMIKHDPGFVIHTGDYVYNGRNQKLWNKWFYAMEGLLGNVPFMGTLGNHDNDAINYFDQFIFPNNEMYYSFDYGNAHFMMIYKPKRGESIEPGTPQYSWIENDLRKAAANKNIKWKFAFWHVPGYSASMVGRDKKIIKTLYPLLEKYDVDIVFNGHRHNYERTHIIKEDKVVKTGSDFIYKDNSPGIISVVSGGGGGPLTKTKTDWWTAYTEKTHHFCHVSIDGNKLEFKAIRPDNTILDSFTIVKETDSTSEAGYVLKENNRFPRKEN